MSYVITVPLKTKKQRKLHWHTSKEILPKTSHSLYILKDKGTDFQNDHLISTFKSLGIK